MKLGKIDQLQNQLVSITNQLQLERKQLQLTRWVQLNKINKLKQEKPELGDVLADLMKPVKISDVNSGVDVFGEEKVEEGNEEDAVMDVDKEETTPNTDDSIPISISKPKEYQFWSG